MAHDKKLLDDVTADVMQKLIHSMYIKQQEFKDDSGRAVRFNRLVIKFKNGDDAEIKLEALPKAAFYYALRDASVS